MEKEKKEVMEYNVCKTCDAKNGMAGILIDGECQKCIKNKNKDKFYFKNIHDQRGCFCLCVIHDEEKNSFRGGVALVHKLDQRCINWKKGRSIAAGRANTEMNNVIKRMGCMVETHIDGSLISLMPDIKLSHLDVYKKWTDAQHNLMCFYYSIINSMVDPELEVAK